MKHEAGLGRAAVRGLAWTMLRSVSSRVVGGLVFVVLARLLWPLVPDEGARALETVLVPCDDLGTPGDIDFADEVPDRLREDLSE